LRYHGSKGKLITVIKVRLL